MTAFTTWYAIPENREKHLAKMRARYQANKPEYLAKAAKWMKEHPEKYKQAKREYDKRRRAAKKQADYLAKFKPLPQAQDTTTGESQ